MVRKSFSICLAALGMIAGLAHAVTTPTKPPRQVNIPGHPFAAVSSLDGRWIFVSVISSNAAETSGVAVLSWNDSQISLRRLIALDPAPQEAAGRELTAPTGMAVTPDGRLLIAAHDKFLAFLDVKRAINSKDDPVLGFMRIGRDAFNVHVNVTHDGKYLFVSAAEGHSGSIVVIDLERARKNGFSEEAIIGRIPAGLKPVSLVFSPDEKLLYALTAVAATEWGWPLKCQSEVGAVAIPEGAIVIVDAEKAKRDPAGAVLGRAPIGCVPARLDIAPDGGSIWITVRTDDSVAGYDTLKLLTAPEHARIARVPVGHAPVGIIVTRDGKYVLNTNSAKFRADANSPQTVTVIDRASAVSGSAATVSSIETGVFPRELSLSADGRTIFVTNYLSNTLSLLDVEHLLSH